MKELKALNANELLAKLKANAEALSAFEAAGLTSSDYYKAALSEKEAIEAELSGRKAEMVVSATAEAIKATVSKELSGKEGDIEGTVTLSVSITKSEDGSISVEVNSGRKRSSVSGVARSSGERGERKSVVITTLTGEVITAASAAAGLQALKDAGVVPQVYGEGDSAVRVLNSLLAKNQIAGFERIETEKTVTAETEVGNTNGETESPDEETSTKKKSKKD